MMAVVHKYTASGMGSGTSYCPAKANDDHFPAGMRVLVVDDDTTCLKLLERMLQSCSYHVTTCPRATTALSLLRENKGAFDLVISDVHMPDMDGFKLLELVGLEMDLPVIMMSADGRTSLVMRGIRHGACDYLLKPVRMEELKNIWQHVVRKKFNDNNKEHENSGSLEESDRQKKAADENEYASSVNDGTDSGWKAQKKKRDAKDDDDDGELDNDDPSASKKPRVVWSVELHQQFVSAVNQLGIDKAVPKRILELMNVPGLTRENVASHLQKFRLYLKRLSGVAQHQNGLPNSYCGSIESNSKVNPLSRLDIQALAASGQLPSQLVAYQAEMLGRPSGSMVLHHLDQPHLLQASVSGPNYIPGVSFGQPLIKCQSNLSKQFSQTYPGEDVSPGFATWSPSPSSLVPSPASSLTGLNNLHSSNVLAQMLPPQQTQSVLSDPSHGINNVQPSCLVVPSQSPNFQGGSNHISTNPNALIAPAQSSPSYQIGNNTAHINQTSSYTACNTLADYSLMSSQPSHAPLGIRQGSNGDLKNAGLLNGYSFTGPVPPSVSPSLISTDGSSQWTAQNSIINISSCRLPGPSPSFCDIQGKEDNIGAISGNVQLKNFGFVGKGTSIPSRYAVDDIESPTDDLNQKKSLLDDGTKVKQEVNLDFMEGSKGGNISYFSPGDFMSVLSK